MVRQLSARSRIGRLLFLVLTIGIGFLQIAIGQPAKQSLQDEIEGVYARWNALTGARDVERLIKMLHRDHAYADETGKLEQRPAFENRLRESFQRSRNLTNSSVILRVEGSRRDATAWTIYGVKMEYQEAGKWVPVEYKLKTQDRFVKERGSWLLLSSKVLPE